MSTKPGDPTTNPTIFLRLRAGDAVPREIAWTSSIPAMRPSCGFARRLAARTQDVDDVVQDVLMGFFLNRPRSSTTG